MFLRFFILFCFAATWLSASEPCCEELIRDLRTLDCIEHKIQDRLPLIYNFYGQMGYFALPSARAAPDGDITGGYSSVPPYHNYFIAMQVFQRIELAGVYRVFSGVPDLTLGARFGDYSDKGVNIKFNFLLPEDTDYALPGFAFGMEDFEGSKFFFGQYFVFTQVLPRFNAEITLGYGLDRMSGFFGAMALSPWRHYDSIFFSPITFIAEWDPIDYEDMNVEPHPGARRKKSKVNWGLQYSLNRWFRLSVGRFRGDVYTVQGSLSWDIGQTKGLLPKIKNPHYYTAPANKQPIGSLRSKATAMQDIAYGLDLQGFTLIDAFLEPCGRNRSNLRLIVVNRQWREERVVHARLASLLAFLTPSNVETVTVVMSADTVLCQEYCFRQHDLKLYACRQMSENELMVLSPMREYTPVSCKAEHLYDKDEMVFDWGIRPRFRTFFGSASGKFKFAIDILAVLDGFYEDIYYRVVPGYTPISTMGHINPFDTLNPSQLLQVNSDLVRYYQSRDVRFEEAYLQKNLNLAEAMFGRISAGFYSVNYAGGCLEALYFPVGSRWAMGVEGALLRKRNYSSWGFQSFLKKRQGAHEILVPYTALSQYFLDLYYTFQIMPVTLKVTIGQFLAQDLGVRTELFRFFPSGLRLSIWYTVTNAHDVINGSVYHDKGFSISMPLDVLFEETSRLRFGTAMSAWLRDVGYRADTGRPLYETIFFERY